MPQVLSPHQHVESQLREWVTSGEYRPGDKLPPERVLAESLGVSRTTLRHAVDGLQLDGLFVRVSGRSGGTFVSERAPVVELTALEGFMPQLKARGHEVDSTVLAYGTVEAPEQVGLALGLEAGAMVHHVRRLRRVNGAPLVLEDSWLPAELFPGLDPGSLTGSIYAMLAERFGSAPVRKVEEITSASVGGTNAELFEASARLPALRILRTAYRQDGTAVEYSEDTYRADRLRVRVTSASSNPRE